MSGDNSKKGDAERTITAPAKINLMLSVHGRRADGFHALTSVFVPVRFGDRLSVAPLDAGEDRLEGGGDGMPSGAENTILRAASVFRDRLGRSPVFRFRVEKRIPAGAGLGGGSTDAAAALRGMNGLAGEPFGLDELREMAAGVGSDCPFFIDPRPGLVRGRGEIVEPFGETLAARLYGQRLALFRPPFGVETAWAYRRLASQAPGGYEPEALAAERIRRFREGEGVDVLLRNSFAAAVGEKFPAIPELLADLRAEGWPCLMSGSGSCCFVLAGADGAIPEAVGRKIRDAWGTRVFYVETSVGLPEDVFRRKA